MRLDGIRQFGTKLDAATRAVDARAATPTTAHVDRRAEAGAIPYLDQGEGLLLAEMTRQGLSPEAFDALELRGLAALIGKGFVPSKDLPPVVEGMKRDPKALGVLLSEKRDGYLERVGKEHGIPLSDGSSRWTVQEIANLDYILSEMPESFMTIVRQGPPFRKEAASASYTGLYNPFTNTISINDRANRGGDTLAEVHESEQRMRGTMIMEMAHAWQIRQTSLINPGAGGIFKGIRGIVYPERDIISEWSTISGWTVRPKWSPWGWFGGGKTPNSSNASHQLANLEFTLFGRNLKLDLTDLRYDPAKESTFVSNYAKHDPYEDFGESVIAYFTDPEVLKRRSPEKYDYVRKTIMGGREYQNRYGNY